MDGWLVGWLVLPSLPCPPLRSSDCWMVGWLDGRLVGTALRSVGPAVGWMDGWLGGWYSPPSPALPFVRPGVGLFGQQSVPPFVRSPRPLPSFPLPCSPL